MQKSNREFCEYEYFWVIAQMREYMEPHSIQFMIDTMRQHENVDHAYIDRLEADLLG